MKKAFLLFVNTNSFFDDIVEKMVTKIYRRYLNDYQWRIEGFLTNSSNMHLFSILIKIYLSRSRNRKINFFGGSGQQPDHVPVMNADRESSVILEVDRSKIPIISLVDFNIVYYLQDKDSG
jgi:ribosomal protein S2